MSKETCVWAVQKGFTGTRRSAETVRPLGRDELAGMRGKVFFASGRRRAFMNDDGTYTDIDEYDDLSWHVFGRIKDELVAACRVLHFQDTPETAFEKHAGPAAAAKYLAAKGLSRVECGEASRWVVMKRERGGRLAARAIAGGWGVVQWLKCRGVWAWAGTRDGQSRALMRMGGQPVEGLPLLRSDSWDDELQALYFEIQNPPAAMVPLIAEMKTLLSI